MFFEERGKIFLFKKGVLAHSSLILRRLSPDLGLLTRPPSFKTKTLINFVCI
jgi:hypothetical protein